MSRGSKVGTLDDGEKSLHQTVREIFIQDDVRRLQSLRQGRWPSDEEWADFLDSDGTTNNCAVTSQASHFKMNVPDSLSKPLLVLFMCGAKDCCTYVLDTLETSLLMQISQPSGNILHAIVCGSEARVCPEDRFIFLLNLLKARLPQSVIRSLNSFVGFQGLRPAELAMLTGEYKLAERMLTDGLLTRIHSEVRSAYQFSFYELNDYDSLCEDSRFHLSPLLLLCVGKATKVKDSGILREESVMHSWARSIIHRNGAFHNFSCFFLLLSIVILSLTGNKYSHQRLSTACNFVFEEQVTIGEISTEIVCICNIFLSACFSLWTSVPLVIIFYKQWKGGLDMCQTIEPFRNYLLYDFAPAFLNILCIAYWLHMMIEPSSYCEATDMPKLSIVMTGILAFSSLQYGFLAHQNSLIGKFMNNLMFVTQSFYLFILFYFFVIFAFANSMTNYYTSQQLYQNISLSNVKDDNYAFFKGPFESSYTIFRLSLSIVDLPRKFFDTYSKAMHIFLVLTLPFLNFNYIIGVITSRLGRRMEVEEEIILMHTTFANLIVEKQFSFLRKCWNSCTGSKTSKMQVYAVHSLS